MCHYECLLQNSHGRYGTLVERCVEIRARGIIIASIVDIRFILHRFELAPILTNFGYLNVFLNIYDH